MGAAARRNNMPKTSCLQVFLGTPIEGKALEIPAGEVIGGTVEMVCLLIQSRGAFLLTQHEGRPILHGDEAPPVIQLIVPKSRIEQLIGALASLRDEEVKRVITPDQEIVTPEGNPATELQE